MKFLDTINWSEIWNIIKDVVIPHSGTLILNIILFLGIGFITSIIYILVLSKRRVLKREAKYYNWAVKLYIPILIIGFLYIFGQIGAIRGIYCIIQKEEKLIVSGISTSISKQFFESEESKNEFIKEIQQTAIEVKEGNDAFVGAIKSMASVNNTGYSLIDKSKNKISEYLIEKYGGDLYKITMYGIINAATPHADMSETLSYKEFNIAMDLLIHVGHKDIERSIADKLTVWFDHWLSSQYRSLVYSLLITLIIIMIIPLFEYGVYRFYIKPRYLEKPPTTEIQKN